MFHYFHPLLLCQYILQINTYLTYINILLTLIRISTSFKLYIMPPEQRFRNWIIPKITENNDYYVSYYVTHQQFSQLP